MSMTKHAKKRTPNPAIKEAISKGLLNPALGSLSRQHLDANQSLLIEVDVAADGHCFYRAAAMQFLLDKRDDLSAFEKRFNTLFGSDAATLAEIKNMFDGLQFYDGSVNFALDNIPQLQKLTGFPLRKRLADYMREHADELSAFFASKEELANHLILMTTDKNSWAGELEFRSLSLMLDVQIECYEGSTSYENLEMIGQKGYSHNIEDYYVRTISPEAKVYGEKSDCVLRILHDQDEHEHFSMLLSAESLLRPTVAAKPAKAALEIKASDADIAAKQKELHSARLTAVLRKHRHLWLLVQFFHHHWLKMLLGAAIGSAAAALIVFAGAFVLATAATICIAAAIGLVAGASLSGMLCKVFDYLRQKKQTNETPSVVKGNECLQALENGSLKPAFRDIDKPAALKGNYRNREASGTLNLSLTHSPQLTVFGTAAPIKDPSGHGNLIYTTPTSITQKAGQRFK